MAPAIIEPNGSNKSSTSTDMVDIESAANTIRSGENVMEDSFLMPKKQELVQGPEITSKKETRYEESYQQIAERTCCAHQHMWIRYCIIAVIGITFGYILGFLNYYNPSVTTASDFNVDLNHAPVVQCNPSSVGNNKDMNDDALRPHVEMTEPPGFSTDPAENSEIHDQSSTSPAPDETPVSKEEEEKATEMNSDAELSSSTEFSEENSHVMLNTTVEAFVKKCAEQSRTMVEGTYDAEWIKADCGLGYKLPVKTSQTKQWHVHFDGTYWKSLSLALSGCPRAGCPLSPNCVLTYDTEKDPPDHVNPADVIVYSGFTPSHDTSPKQHNDNSASSRKDPYRVLYWREANWPKPSVNEQQKFSFEMGVHFWSGILVSLYHLIRRYQMTDLSSLTHVVPT
jgi:hypothetical protein